MTSLDKLNDKQNHLLAQLSYSSDKLGGDSANGKSLQELYNGMSTHSSKEAKALKECINAGLGDIRIKDTANNSTTGFGAIAFTDSKGNTGITYRGTDGISKDSINDWLGNIAAMVTGTSVQTIEAESFFEKNKDENGNNYLYGHSKGGNLSQSVFVNHYGEIKKVHNLNPQPINPYGLTRDQLAALNSNKLDVVVTEGDYVWFLGGVPYLSRIRVMDNSCGDDAHSYSSKRYDNNGDIINGKQPWFEYIAILLVPSSLELLQMYGGVTQIIYNTGVRVINFVKNDLIPTAKEFVDRMVDEVKKISADLKKFANTVSSFFGDLIKNVSDWWNKNFDAGYKYANANPYVDINTTTMHSYATKLRNLSGRSKRLDSRMNSLYWHVGFDWNTFSVVANLGKLLKAEVILDFAHRLDECANYLNDTANEFESVEREIVSNC